MNDKPDRSRAPEGSLSRRDFLRGGVAVGIGTAALGPNAAGNGNNEPAVEDAARGTRLRGPTRVTLRINGEERDLTVEPRTSLLSALRDHLAPALTGTKLVCDGGNCGACTVHLDGRPAASCMVLALDAVGREVTTIEGLGEPGDLSPLQERFCASDGMMCGFCTPGFVMAISAELDRNPDATEDEVRDACAGNLCRCGTYPQIFEAAMSTVRSGRGSNGGSR